MVCFRGPSFQWPVQARRDSRVWWDCPTPPEVSRRGEVRASPRHRSDAVIPYEFEKSRLASVDRRLLPASAPASGSL